MAEEENNIKCHICNCTGEVSDGIYHKTKMHGMFMSGTKPCGLCNGTGYRVV